MKNLFKNLGKFVRAMVVFKVIRLAFIGSGDVVKKRMENPDLTNRQATYEADMESTNIWKKFIKRKTS